jgi:hypothetical protein
VRFLLPLLHLKSNHNRQQSLTPQVPGFSDSGNWLKKWRVLPLQPVNLPPFMDPAGRSTFGSSWQFVVTARSKADIAQQWGQYTGGARVDSHGAAYQVRGQCLVAVFTPTHAA